MADALVGGERIEIRGFGSFDLHHRAPRIGRNPKTGESLSLPAKVKVHFKPGKEMRDRVDAACDQCDITE
jgi:integration host factor subunit beta